MFIPRRRRHWLLPHVTKLAPPPGPGYIVWAPEDDFNRADGALGPDWTDLLNGFLIDTNRAAPTNVNSLTAWNVSPPVADYWAQVVTPQLAIGPNAPGVAIRITAVNTLYALTATIVPAFCHLRKFVAGVPTIIQTYAYPGAPVTLRLAAVGNQLTPTINGVPQAAETDNSITDAGRVGIVSIATGVALQPVDDFSAGY